MRLHKVDRKGVSPIIATLLLIVIAVAAAVVTYTFVMGFVGTGMQSTMTAQGQLNYDAFKVNGTDDSSITIYLRNTGGRALLLNSVYVDGERFEYNSTMTNESTIWGNMTNGQWCFFVNSKNTTSLDVGQAGTLYIASDTPAARTQLVRIICADGTMLEIAVRK